MLFVNAQMKFRYDNKHKSLMLKVDDIIYLRLHKSYYCLINLTKNSLINISIYFSSNDE